MKGQCHENEYPIFRLAKFRPDRITRKFCKSLSPLYPGLSAKPVPAETAYPDFISNCLAHFYVVGTCSIFPHK